MQVNRVDYCLLLKENDSSCLLVSKQLLHSGFAKQHNEHPDIDLYEISIFPPQGSGSPDVAALRPREKQSLVVGRWKCPTLT